MPPPLSLLQIEKDYLPSTVFSATCHEGVEVSETAACSSCTSPSRSEVVHGCHRTGKGACSMPLEHFVISCSACSACSALDVMVLSRAQRAHNCAHTGSARIKAHMWAEDSPHFSPRWRWGLARVLLGLVRRVGWRVVGKTTARRRRSAPFRTMAHYFKCSLTRRRIR